MEKQTSETPLKSRLFAYYEKYMMAMGILGQAVFYIQAFKIFRNQSAQDVSLLGFSFGLISVTSWMIYGIIIKNKVLTLANVVAVIGALLVVAGILIHG